LAVANYRDEKGHYPPPYVIGPDGQPWHSWRVLILPYIEKDDLFKQYKFDEPWDGPNNRKLADRMPRQYALHGDWEPGLTTTNYVAVVGQQTVWQPGKKIGQVDVKDGSSETILIAENRGLGAHWMEPRDLDFDTMDWTINSPNGISSKYDRPAVVLLDGSVRRLSRTISPDALRALFTIAGNETVSFDSERCDVLPDGRDRPVTDP
jgi:hypothetical protein